MEIGESQSKSSHFSNTFSKVSSPQTFLNDVEAKCDPQISTFGVQEREAVFKKKSCKIPEPTDLKNKNVITNQFATKLNEDASCERKTKDNKNMVRLSLLKKQAIDSKHEAMKAIEENV